uniref:Uncharacterized protein n=1 Tax=Branchiostoma floridae TaxID=7739 RepID=C3ZIX1_BRAFL|eukprot:XP_002591476.1 hypothetical protein BRAFLDRAFT_105246 [Branchiostoma floridae]
MEREEEEGDAEAGTTIMPPPHLSPHTGQRFSQDVGVCGGVGKHLSRDGSASQADGEGEAAAEDESYARVIFAGAKPLEKPSGVNEEGNCKMMRVPASFETKPTDNKPQAEVVITCKRMPVPYVSFESKHQTGEKPKAAVAITCKDGVAKREPTVSKSPGGAEIDAAGGIEATHPPGAAHAERFIGTEKHGSPPETPTTPAYGVVVGPASGPKLHDGVGSLDTPPETTAVDEGEAEPTPGPKRSSGARPLDPPQDNEATAGNGADERPKRSSGTEAPHTLQNNEAAAGNGEDERPKHSSGARSLDPPQDNEATAGNGVDERPKRSSGKIAPYTAKQRGRRRGARSLDPPQDNEATADNGADERPKRSSGARLLDTPPENEATAADDGKAGHGTRPKRPISDGPSDTLLHETPAGDGLKAGPQHALRSLGAWPLRTPPVTEINAGYETAAGPAPGPQRATRPSGAVPQDTPAGSENTVGDGLGAAPAPGPQRGLRSLGAWPLHTPPVTENTDGDGLGAAPAPGPQHALRSLGAWPLRTPPVTETNAGYETAAGPVPGPQRATRPNGAVPHETPAGSENTVGDGLGAAPAPGPQRGLRSLGAWPLHTPPVTENTDGDGLGAAPAPGPQHALRSLGAWPLRTPPVTETNAGYETAAGPVPGPQRATRPNGAVPHETPAGSENTVGDGLGAAPAPGPQRGLRSLGAWPLHTPPVTENTDGDGLGAGPAPGPQHALRSLGAWPLRTPPETETNAGYETAAGPAPGPQRGLRSLGAWPLHTPPVTQAPTGDGQEAGPATVDGPDSSSATGISTDKTTVIGRVLRRMTSCPRPVCLVVTAVAMATLIAAIFIWMYLGSQHATGHVIWLTPDSGVEGTGMVGTEMTWTGSGSAGNPEATTKPTGTGSGSTGKPEATTKPTGIGSGSTGTSQTTNATGSGNNSTGTPEAINPTGSGNSSTSIPEATKMSGTGSGSESTRTPEATKAAATAATTYKTTVAAGGDEGVANETIVFAIPELSDMGLPLPAGGASVSDGQELFLSLTMAKRVKVYSLTGVPLREFRTVDGPGGLPMVYSLTGVPLREFRTVDGPGGLPTVYSLTGVPLREFRTVDGPGGAPTVTPEDLAVDAAGHVWVVGNVEARTVVVRYNRLGRALSGFRLGGLFFNWRGIATDRAEGTVLVTGSGWSAVQVAAVGDEGVANETIVFAIPELSDMGLPLPAGGASVSDGQELFLSLTMAKRVKAYSLTGVPLREFRTVDGPGWAADSNPGGPGFVYSLTGVPLREFRTVDGPVGLPTVYSLTGVPLREFRTLDGPDGAPTVTQQDLTVDTAGHVWVVGNVEARTVVVRYNRLGRALSGFRLGGLFFNWRGIATDRAEGTVLVTGSGWSAVQVYRPDGSLVRKFGGREIGAPLRVAVNGRGRVFVSDGNNHIISVFTRHGFPIRRIGGQGSADGFLSRPQGLCLDRAGKLIVADRDNKRVQTAPGSSSWQTGITSGSRGAGNLIVVDRDNRRVQVGEDGIDSRNLRVDSVKFRVDSGKGSSSAGSEGAADGFLSRPQGLCVDPAGRIIVSDRDNRRVQGRFRGVKGRFRGVKGRFREVKGRFREVKGRFRGVKGRFREVKGRFRKVKGRFREVKGRFREVKGRFRGVKGRFREVKGRFREVKGRLREVKGRLREGFLIRRIGGQGSAEGFLSRPQGLCLHRAGRIIVADRDNRRVQVFSPRGQHVRTFRTAGFPLAVAVGPSGQLVVTMDFYGLIYIYPTY